MAIKTSEAAPAPVAGVPATGGPQAAAVNIPAAAQQVQNNPKATIPNNPVQAKEVMDIRGPLQIMITSINGAMMQISKLPMAEGIIDSASQTQGNPGLHQQEITILTQNIQALNQAANILQSAAQKFPSFIQNQQARLRAAQQMPATTASSKFNSKKMAQVDPFASPAAPAADPTQVPQAPQPMAQPQGQAGPFKDQAALKDWLDTTDFGNAKNTLLQHAANQEDFEGKLKVYYEGKLPDTEQLTYVTNVLWPALNDSIKVPEVGNQLIQAQPAKVKGNGMEQKQPQAPENQPPQQEVMAFVRELVQKTALVIEKKAQTDAISSNKSFNMKKHAQHKSLEGVMLWGPDSKRIDPFSGQIISDWHVVERNKGWGLKVGDVWNLDFETMWRTHIMDKYSRPYRDKDGNWVGGYIEKRFEVDKWIPETNNYQLKPDERRKPRLPEYGSIESRMSAQRAKAGEGPKPTNWNEASSTSTVKTASVFNSKKKMT